jgi:hypothetical protein
MRPIGHPCRLKAQVLWYIVALIACCCFFFVFSQLN